MIVNCEILPEARMTHLPYWVVLSLYRLMYEAALINYTNISIVSMLVIVKNEILAEARCQVTGTCQVSGKDYCLKKLLLKSPEMAFLRF